MEGFSASVTTKFGLVFFLTLENAFFSAFILNLTEKTGSKKTVIGILKIALRLRDGHVFTVEVLNIFNTLILKQILWKTEIFFN